MNEIVFRGANNQALTNSLLVAETFGKEHRNVMQSIRSLIGTAENSAVLEMFEETTYKNEQNKEQPMFLMNRDGFSLLVMGFTIIYIFRLYGRNYQDYRKGRQQGCKRKGAT